jgi:hypothetical protein
MNCGLNDFYNFFTTDIITDKLRDEEDLVSGYILTVLKHRTVNTDSNAQDGRARFIRTPTH